MGTSAALIIFGVTIAAGAVLKCDEEKGQSIGTGLPNPIGDYINIAINEHYPDLGSSGITPQGVVLPNSQNFHHGANIFIKPHMVLSPGNEQSLIPLLSGNQKVDDFLSFAPQYSPDMMAISGAAQPVPEQSFVVSVPEPLLVSMPQSPVIQEPFQSVNDELPLVIPPAPELPPLKMPELPVPVISEDTPISQEVPMIQLIPQTLPEPLPQDAVIQAPIQSVNDELPLVMPPAPELPPLETPALPVPVIIEDTPIRQEVPIVQLIPQSLTEPIVLPLPLDPVIWPVIEDSNNIVNNKLPMVIPPAPELPPLQVPVLPVPVVFEEKQVSEQVSNLQSTEALIPTVQREPEVPSNAILELNKETPTAPALMLPVDIIELPNNQMTNIFGVAGLEHIVPIKGGPEVNQQPIFIAELPQYPTASNQFQLGAQKEIIAQPCPPQLLHTGGLIQIHQYINSASEAVRSHPAGLGSIIYKK